MSDAVAADVASSAADVIDADVVARDCNLQRERLSEDSLPALGELGTDAPYGPGVHLALTFCRCLTAAGASLVEVLVVPVLEKPQVMLKVSDCVPGIPEAAVATDPGSVIC